MCVWQGHHSHVGIGMLAACTPFHHQQKQRTAIAAACMSASSTAGSLATLTPAHTHWPPHTLEQTFPGAPDLSQRDKSMADAGLAGSMLALRWAD